MSAVNYQIERSVDNMKSFRKRLRMPLQQRIEYDRKREHSSSDWLL